MKPLHDMTAQDVRAIRWVVSDIDGTLTREGRMCDTTLGALSMLKEAGFTVVLATGRSAGMGQSLALYLPHITGVICENGALYFDAITPRKPAVLRGGLRSSTHLRQLEAAFARLRTVYPQLNRTEDDMFRLTEIAMVRDPAFGPQDLEHMAEVVGEFDCSITYSSIHIHIMGHGVDKWRMVEKQASRQGLEDPRTRVLTIGDSVNDAMLFDPQNVICSVGVAQVAEYRSVLEPRVPRFVTPSAEVDGFMEMAETLCTLTKEHPA